MYQGVMHHVTVPYDEATLKTNIANAIQTGSKLIGLSMQYIANSIIEEARILSASIDKIEEEIERKNKQDEYYMLLEKIDMYEDFLMEKGILDEEYQKMQLTEIPLINLTSAQITMIANYFNDYVPLLKKYIQNTLEHPLSTLKNLFFEEIQNNKKGSFSEQKYFFSLPYELVKAIKDLSKKEEMRRKMGEEDYKQKKDEAITCLKEEISKFISNFSERYEDIKHQITDEYIEFNNLIEKVNRDRILINLRNLHSNLRLAVRDAKINSNRKNI